MTYMLTLYYIKIYSVNLVKKNYHVLRKISRYDKFLISESSFRKYFEEKIPVKILRINLSLIFFPLLNIYVNSSSEIIKVDMSNDEFHVTVIQCIHMHSL